MRSFPRVDLANKISIGAYFVSVKPNESVFTKEKYGEYYAYVRKVSKVQREERLSDEN